MEATDGVTLGVSKQNAMNPIINKMGTSKVGAISKAQKSKIFKIAKGGPFGLFENPVCCKI